MEADAIDAPAAEWLSALGEAAPGQGGDGAGSGIPTPIKGSPKGGLGSQEALEAKGGIDNERPENMDYLHMENEGRAQLDRMESTASEKKRTNGGASPREYGEGHVASVIGAMSVEQEQEQEKGQGQGEKALENMGATSDRGSLQSASAPPPANVETALEADAEFDAVVER